MSDQIIKKPNITVFLVCTFFYWFALYSYVPTMTPYLADLGISFSMIGLIGGSYGFSQMLLRIPLGVLSDKLGKRKLFILLGLMITALSSAGMYFTENAFMFLALRFFAGVSASAWVVFTVLYMGYFDKSRHASQMSYLFMINGLGLMSSKFLGGLIADRFGHEYTFLLGGAAGLIALALGFFITEKAPEIKELPTLKSLFGVIKNKNLMAMSILGIFLQMVVHSTVNTFTPQAATEVGADLMALGVLSTVATIPSVIASFICGKLFLRRNIKVCYVTAFSFLLFIIGSLIIPFTSSMFAVYVSTIILGFGSGICMSALLGFCTNTVDDNRRAGAMGFFQAIYGFGMFAGPVIVGIFVDKTGLSSGFFTASAFAVIGFVLTFILLGRSEIGKN